MKEKVVVFGGSGFLGSHVSDYLTKSGYNVVIFDIKKSQYLKEGQEMVIGDILDNKLVNDTIKGSKYVYHFAGIADIKEAQEKPTEAIKTNILSMAYILESCLKHKIDRLVYSSTIYVYSTYGSFYRSTKQAAELLIENYFESFGLNYTILRYGSLYGPRANSFNLINRVIISALKKGKIVRGGNGEELREYIHVLDAAKASVKILSDQYLSSNILITGSKAMRIKEFFNMLNEIFDNKLKIDYTDKETNDRHYNITPYTFKPKVARRYQLDGHIDLGQGILDQIHTVYQKLLISGEVNENNQFTMKDG